MKKTICFALSLIIVLMMCACSSKSQSPVATPAPSQEVMAEPISEESCEMVRDALPYYAYAEFDTDENGVVKVDVKVDSDDLPHYGDLIFRTLYTAENVFGNLDFVIHDESGNEVTINPEMDDSQYFKAVDDSLTARFNTFAQNMMPCYLRLLSGTGVVDYAYNDTMMYAKQM